MLGRWTSIACALVAAYLLLPPRSSSGQVVAPRPPLTYPSNTSPGGPAATARPPLTYPSNIIPGGPAATAPVKPLTPLHFGPAPSFPPELFKPAPPPAAKEDRASIDVR